jgi:hypothetical protein
VLGQAADKSLLFFICGACLAISSVLWLLVRDDRAAPVAALAASH